MIVLDTGALFAALNPDQREHDDARAVLAAERGRLVLSPFVLAELDYLIAVRARSVEPELAMLDQVASGHYELAPFTAEDVGAAARIVKRYANLDVGLTDASIVVLAHRYGTRRVFTLDERHFRALRTLDGKRFTLLPADGRAQPEARPRSRSARASTSG